MKALLTKSGSYNPAPATRSNYAPIDGLPADTRIRHVSLRVARLARSLFFYEELLGFQRLPPAETPPGRTWLTAPGQQTVLLELCEEAVTLPVPPGGLLGLNHVAVQLPTRADLGRLYQHLRRQHAVVRTADHRTTEALYLTDPDGLGIKLYYERPRGEWPEACAGEMPPVAAPLDMRPVVAVAGPELYQGLPAGTCIGHMQFNVDNLDQAAAFYQAGLGLGQAEQRIPNALLLAAGGRRQHVGLSHTRRQALLPTAYHARLLAWEMTVPTQAAADAAAARLRRQGFLVTLDGASYCCQDPWGQVLRLTARNRRRF